MINWLNTRSSYLNEKESNESDENFMRSIMMMEYVNLYSNILNNNESTFFESIGKYINETIDKLTENVIISSYINYNVTNNQEAFADNIVRMYGYGSHLSSAVFKLNKYMHSGLNKHDVLDIEIDKSHNIIHSNTITRILAIKRELDDEIKNRDGKSSKLMCHLIAEREKINKLLKINTSGNTDLTKAYKDIYELHKKNIRGI